MYIYIKMYIFPKVNQFHYDLNTAELKNPELSSVVFSW